MDINFFGGTHFLSNFYQSDMVVNGKLYRTNEHFYQAHKTSNEKEHEQIRNQVTPYQAKQIARHVTLIPDWDNKRIEVMKIGLEEKFKNPILKKKLLETLPYNLIENSPYDNFWGCGKDGKGKNMLGQLLMNLRATLHASCKN
jgi:ribA/ribD-fused uncharacterized protein